MLRDIAVLLVVPDVLECLTLQKQAYASQQLGEAQEKEDKRTSMGLNGFAIRPMVDE